MADVRADQRGYFDGQVREIGEKFVIDDEIMNDKNRRPSWVSPVKAGSKGDHDSDDKIADLKPAAGKPAKATKPPKVEPFADAPEPIDGKPKGNGVKEALGVDPDWVPPAPKPID